MWASSYPLKHTLSAWGVWFQLKSPSPLLLMPSLALGWGQHTIPIQGHWLKPTFLLPLQLSFSQFYSKNTLNVHFITKVIQGLPFWFSKWFELQCFLVFIFALVAAINYNNLTLIIRTKLMWFSELEWDSK